RDPAVHAAVALHVARHLRDELHPAAVALADRAEPGDRRHRRLPLVGSRTRPSPLRPLRDELRGRDRPDRDRRLVLQEGRAAVRRRDLTATIRYLAPRAADGTIAYQ